MPYHKYLLKSKVNVVNSLVITFKNFTFVSIYYRELSYTI